MWAKRPLNGVRKFDGHTDRQTDTRTSRLIESIGLRADALKINSKLIFFLNINLSLNIQVS